jgi:hypothetical protein
LTSGTYPISVLARRLAGSIFRASIHRAAVSDTSLWRSDRAPKATASRRAAFASFKIAISPRTVI